VTQSTSLYRRHRPQSFADVVGQEHVVRTLSNAITNDRVNHAYLFVGSRGTGKTSMAKILARSLNCVEGPTLTPCGKCESCVTIAAGTSVDVAEMDAASNRSVDDVRELRERVGYAPAAGHWKVFILDEAHMLTREAWNAFLKTLEEPPPRTVFVLATTEAHKVMPTIIDRCQRFDFQRPSIDDLATVIRRVSVAEGIEIEDGAVTAIARSATGSFRDALGTLDQLVAYGGKKVATDDVLAVLGVADTDLILETAAAIAAGNGREVVACSETLTRSGRDPVRFATDLIAHLRQLVVMRVAPEAAEVFTMTAAPIEKLREQAEAFTDLGLTRAIDALSAAVTAVRAGDDARMTIELALLKAARPQLDGSREALLQRLERIEKLLEGGMPAGAAAPAAAPIAEAPEPPAAKTPEPPARASTPEPRAARADAPAATAAEPEQVFTRVSTPPAGGAPATLTTEGSSAHALSHEPVTVDEPEPAPEAATEPGVPDTPIDVERLTTIWPQLIDRIRSEYSDTHALVLESAWPIRIDAAAGVVELGLPSDLAFYKKRGERPEEREQFAESLRHITGAYLRPTYALMENAPPGLAEEESLLEGEALIEKFKQEFDAVELEPAYEPDDTPEEMS